MFVTEKFNIIPFWAPALKSPAENGIPKKYLDTSLAIWKHSTHSSHFAVTLPA